MAAVTFAVDTADTTGSPLTSGAFTPAAGDLLVVVASVSASVDAAPTCTSSVGGQTFSFIFLQQQSATHQIMVFVCDQLATAVSQTVTVDVAGDPSTGTIVTVLRVSGMTRTGATAVLQSAGNEGTSGVTPNIVFAASTLTTNPIIVGGRVNLNPAAFTEPASFTEHSDSGHASPNQGQATASRNSGHTSATVTWGAAQSVSWSAIGVELDTTSAADGGYSTAVQAVSGLVEYWRLGEPSGTTVVAEVGDSGGYINSPTLGSTGLLVGDSDTAVTLTGTGQKTAQIQPATAMPTGATARTVLLWVKQSTTATDATLFSYGTASTRQAFGLKAKTDGTVEVWTFGDDHAWSSTNALNGTTHMIAVVYDGSTNVKLYFDGTLKSPDFTLGASLNTVIDGNGVRMGVDFFQNVNFMDGVLDEVAVWNRALSGAEITSLYQWGLGLGGYSRYEQEAAVFFFLLEDSSGVLLLEESTFLESRVPYVNHMPQLLAH